MSFSRSILRMVAEACGARAVSPSNGRRMQNDVLREALAHDGPTVVQAVVDPNEPPMPGKITTEQAVQLRQSAGAWTEGRGEDHQDHRRRQDSRGRLGRWRAQSALSIADPVKDLEIIANQIREGRFQRSLSLLTAATSVMSGLEVAYEHYRGSYSRRVMYTPVILSVLLAAAGLAGFFSRRAARTHSPAGLGGHAGRRGDRLLLPHSRHQAKARRLAACP